MGLLASYVLGAYVYGQDWHEDLQFDKAYGIKKQDMPEYLSALQPALNIPEEKMRSLLAGVLSRGKESDIAEFEVIGGSKVRSKYGFIAYARDSNTDEFAVVYAVHMLNFELGPRIETYKKKRLGGLLGKKTVTVVHPPQMSEDEITAFQRTYMKYKALEALRTKGVIKQIPFEEGT